MVGCHGVRRPGPGRCLRPGVGVVGGGRWRWSGPLAAPCPRHARPAPGASRSRAVVPGPVGLGALQPGVCCVSRPLPRLPGRGSSWRPGWCPGGWRRSVPGRPRQVPAPQPGRAGDGCQRPLVPRSRCQPRLTPSVRRLFDFRLQQDRLFREPDFEEDLYTLEKLEEYRRQTKLGA